MARGGLKAGEYTRSYYDLGGVMLGGGSKNGRLARAENVYRDYDGDGRGLIESIPGYRKVASLGAPIQSLKLYKHKYADYLIALAGESIYRIPISERDEGRTYAPIGTLLGEGRGSFSFLGSHYILDGERILKIGATGNALPLEDKDTDVLAPTTYLNAKAYEQRNLISNRCKEKYIFSEPSSYTYGTPVLNYVIIDNELGTCRLSGTSDATYAGKVYVPSKVRIGGKEFLVTEIGEHALASLVNMTELYIAEGVEKIGTYAVRHCLRLERVVIPRSVTELGGGIFSECAKLRELYLGSGIKKMGGGITAGCSSLTQVYFGANEDTFNSIDEDNALADRTVIFNTEYRRVALKIPISGDVKGISALSENGETVDFTAVYEGERVAAVIYESEHAYDGRAEVVAHCTLGDYVGELGEAGEAISGIEAIAGCTVAEAFDGRIFLSGNKRLPNTVFFSARTPATKEGGLYFGEMNYFTDGVGAYGVSAMLAVRDALAVFKAGDDGQGSIYYHTPKSVEDDLMPRIYPTSYVHSGIGTLGGALSFFDDPVFLTKSGLFALEQKAINYERSVSPRSTNVNYSLLSENLSRASLTEWRGYLVIGVGERAYLADSRRTSTEYGHMEYEWFTLRGLGHYQNSTRVYRYDSYERGDYLAHSAPGEIAEGTAYSTIEDGETIFYVAEGDKRYTVYPTDEMRGGDFYPASVYLGIDDLLFFGTTDGTLFVFNSDKRGVAPEYISAAPDFNKAEYLAKMGQRIHPDFYSFDHHAPRYVVSTEWDSCGAPHLTKSTVKHSLTVKYRAFCAAEIYCEVGADAREYTELTSFPAGEFSFAELNFEALPFSLGDYHTVPLSEKEKGWVEKQITLYSDRFASPIGIYQITYRYTIKGRLKKA